MSQRDVSPPSVPLSLGELWRRVQILEAVVPPSGAYLQPDVKTVYGDEWRVMTSLNNFNGGNGSDYVGGSWTASADLTAPWGGYIETTTNDDWFMVAMPNLGPQGSSYAVAVWYYADTDCGKIEIEWATGPIDEFAGAGVGSSTSIIGPNDIAYNSATALNWYNVNNGADPSHDYRWNAYSASPGWGLVVERSPFWLGGADGTMLTANASGYGDFEWNKEFNGGGGADIVWWVRLHVYDKDVSSSGYRAKIAG